MHREGLGGRENWTPTILCMIATRSLAHESTNYPLIQTSLHLQLRAQATQLMPLHMPDAGCASRRATLPQKRYQEKQNSKKIQNLYDSSTLCNNRFCVNPPVHHPQITENLISSSKLELLHTNSKEKTPKLYTSWKPKAQSITCSKLMQSNKPCPAAKNSTKATQNPSLTSQTSEPKSKASIWLRIQTSEKMIMDSLRQRNHQGLIFTDGCKLTIYMMMMPDMENWAAKRWNFWNDCTCVWNKCSLQRMIGKELTRAWNWICDCWLWLWYDGVWYIVWWSLT